MSLHVKKRGKYSRINKNNLKDDYAELYLCNGVVVLIDREDLEKVIGCGRKWTCSYNKIDKRWIVSNKIEGKFVQIHRFILNAPNNLQVDHINHNPLDNRKQNLRLVTNAQNHQNRKKYGRGVYYHKKNKKWYAQLCLNYKTIHIGCYNSKEEAIEKIEEARIKIMPYSFPFQAGDKK